MCQPAIAEYEQREGPLTSDNVSNISIQNIGGTTSSTNQGTYIIEKLSACERVKQQGEHQRCIGEQSTYSVATAKSGINAFARISNVKSNVEVTIEVRGTQFSPEFSTTLTPPEGNDTVTFAPEVSFEEVPSTAEIVLYVEGNRLATQNIGFSRQPRPVIDAGDMAVVNKPTKLDGSNSSDPDGTIESYSWDLDGDGDIDRNGSRVNWIPQSGGQTQTISLLVTDDRGVSNRTTRDIYINSPPIAAFRVIRQEFKQNNQIEFVATNATDRDGDISKYEWDFNADGVVDATGVRVTTTQEPGSTVEVSLTVVDDRGAKDTVTRNVSISIDTDGDRLADKRETDIGTNPSNPDTDGDGLTDGREVELGLDPLAVDTDADGLNDSTEVSIGTDPTATDTDGDGLTDDREVTLDTDPTSADTDEDNLDDDREVTLGTDPTTVDTDADGLTDGEEINLGTDPTSADTDDDGLADEREVALGTDPTTADSDGDGLDDDREVTLGTDPTTADTDGDGLDDGKEISLETDPMSADTDGDGLSDGREDIQGSDPKVVDTDSDLFEDGMDPLPTVVWVPLGVIQAIITILLYFATRKLIPA